MTDTDSSSSIIDLIYKDSEASLKFVQDNANTLTTRLGLLIGFDITLIRLLLDLPDQSLQIKITNSNIFSMLFLSLIQDFNNFGACFFNGDKLLGDLSQRG
jgi:hypothetical protein